MVLAMVAQVVVAVARVELVDLVVAVADHLLVYIFSIMAQVQT